MMTSEQYGKAIVPQAFGGSFSWSMDRAIAWNEPQRSCDSTENVGLDQTIAGLRGRLTEM